MFYILIAFLFLNFTDGPNVPEDYPPPIPKGMNGPPQSN